MKKYSLSIILVIYCFFSLSTLVLWNAKKINTVTGDEPHYLVIASGIVKHGTLEQTAPYKDEFETRKIHKYELAPKRAQPSPENTHAVAGPHGLFNVHNIGLPLLLALPFMFCGVVGAKLSMIFLGALVVVIAWKFSSYFSENNVHKFWVVIAAAICLPFLPASNQIYPDIVAGLIAITGLYWFLTIHQQRTRSHEAFLTIIIVFLPWLQIKFVATCLVLVLAILIKIYFNAKDTKSVLRILMIAGASCIALALYNDYAFGKISGPYQPGALEISKTSLMVLFGLHFDQNQGFLIQNPVNLIGILAIGWIFRFHRVFAFIWALVFLSLIVPNAMHPAWYGGGSLSGRFEWAAAVVFLIPTIYGLLEIGKGSEKIFRTIIAGSILLQLYFFYLYAVSGIYLYNKLAGTLPNAYSIFYFPIHSWLPMLYDSSWAFGYAPNYVWLVLVCALLLMGFLNREKFYNRAPILAFSFLVLIFTAGFIKNDQANEIIYNVAQMPSQTGKILNSSRFAEQNADKLGFINYGPYAPLRNGQYEVTLTYRSTGMASETIGLFDVFNDTTGVQISQIPLHGTNNVSQELKLEFKVDKWKLNLFEFRAHWNGSSNLEVQKIFLKKY
jgi:hypothetical protein